MHLAVGTTGRSRKLSCGEKQGQGQESRLLFPQSKGDAGSLCIFNNHIWWICIRIDISIYSDEVSTVVVEIVFIDIDYCPEIVSSRYDPYNSIDCAAVSVINRCETGVIDVHSQASPGSKTRPPFFVLVRSFVHPSRSVSNGRATLFSYAGRNQVARFLVQSPQISNTFV